MKELIRQIRLCMHMKQDTFAERLNVTLATVNGWESGGAIPDKMQQSKIYDLCKKLRVPVYEMILEKIDILSRDREMEEGRILLYHGSKSGIQGKIAPTSRRQCDLIFAKIIAVRVSFLMKYWRGNCEFIAVKDVRYSGQAV